MINGGGYSMLILPRQICAGVVCVFCMGCADGGQDSSSQAQPDSVDIQVSDAPPRLIGSTSIVVPRMNSDEWLPAIQSLEFDQTYGTLLALGRGASGLVEFDTLGSFVRSFGTSFGSGPGEVRSVVDFAYNDSLVVLLDTRNGKTLIYTRQGDFLDDFPNRKNYWDLALLGDTIAYLPGSNGAAFDLRSVDGNLIGRTGRSVDLPFNQNNSRGLVCFGCLLTSLANQLLVVVNQEESRVSTFNNAGRRVSDFEFLRNNPLISSWSEADRPIIERMQADSKTPDDLATTILKTYFRNFSPIDTVHVGFVVIPSYPEHDDRGYEYWRMSLRDGSIERFGYPSPELGYAAAWGAGSEMYARHNENGGVYKLHLSNAVTERGG